MLITNADAANTQRAMRGLRHIDVFRETETAHRQLLFALAELGLDDADLSVDGLTVALLALNVYRAQQQTQFDASSSEVAFVLSLAGRILIHYRRMYLPRLASMTDRTKAFACKGASKLRLFHLKGERMESSHLLEAALAMDSGAQGV